MDTDAGAARFELANLLGDNQFAAIHGSPALGPKNASLEQLELQASASNGAKAGVYDFSRLQYIHTHLPFLRSVVEAYVSLIMSQPVQSERQTDRLSKFLRASNIGDQSNFSTLCRAFEHAFIYGRAGIRMLKKNQGLQFFPANRYCVVYEESKSNLGAFDVVGYVIARKNTAASPGMFYDRTPGALDQLPSSGIAMGFDIDFITGQASNSDYVFCRPNEFENMYFFGDEFHLDTPLLHDIDRIDLFINLMSVLSQSVANTTSELVLVKLAQDLFQMNTKQIGDIVSTSKSGKDKINDSALGQLNKFANKVSTATNRETLVVPPIVDQFEQIDPLVKISDFTKLYEQAEDFVTRLYGLSTNVLNFQKLPRDASSSPIFEQMFKTSVYPKRTIVAYRLTNLFSSTLGTGRVWFAPEEFSAGQRITRAQSIANVVATLGNVENVPADVLARITDLLTND